MLKIKLLKKGKLEEMALPKEFDMEIKKSLLDQAVRVYEDRSHFGFAKVKTRSEVDRTKKKVYKQKGTGGARHGAKSAHIFVGGGVVHGPTGIKKTLKLSDALRQKALVYAVSFASKNKKVMAVDGLSSVKKTSEAAKLVSEAKRNSEVNASVLAVLPSQANASLKFFRNLKGTNTVLLKDLNAFKVLKSSLVVFDADVFEAKTQTKKEVKSEKSVKAVKTGKAAK